jgi:hypothetical protein
MAIDWRVNRVRTAECGHGLDVATFDIEFAHDGTKRQTELDYHIVDLLAMGDDLDANIRHLIEVHVAHTVNVMAAAQRILAAQGLSGTIESVETVLRGHEAGTAEDHPAPHAPETAGSRSNG